MLKLLKCLTREVGNWDLSYRIRMQPLQLFESTNLENWITTWKRNLVKELLR